jgi:hypothetical protein
MRGSIRAFALFFYVFLHTFGNLRLIENEPAGLICRVFSSSYCSDCDDCTVFQHERSQQFHDHDLPSNYFSLINDIFIFSASIEAAESETPDAV